MNKKVYDVAIIGAGPAGMFTAYELADSGLDIVIIDRGRELRSRFCPVRLGKECAHCKPCNIMNGFGGAGLFSDCKLSLTPYDVGGNISDYVGVYAAESLMEYVNNTINKLDPEAKNNKVIGAKKNRKYYKIKNKLKSVGLDLTYCPTKHLGTDGSIRFMQAMYNYLLGRPNVTFKFNTEVVNIAVGKEFKTLITNDKVDFYIYADKVVFAPGRSGNSWLKKMASKLDIETKNNGFDIGFRVELPYKVTKELTDNLYDMKISYTDPNTGIKVRTFCTNPKGYVSEEHYNDGSVLANGHSYANKKSKNTNFAVLVHLPYCDTTFGKSTVLGFSKFSEEKILVQNFVEYYKLKRNSNKSTELTLKTAEKKDFSLILPPEINKNIFNFLQMLNVAYPGITESTTNLYGIEAKFYSDLIKVNEHFETNIPGIYAIGDGSGITRGIMQSSMTGVVVARHIRKKDGIY